MTGQACLIGKYLDVQLLLLMASDPIGLNKERLRVALKEGIDKYRLELIRVSQKVRSYHTLDPWFRELQTGSWDRLM